MSNEQKTLTITLTGRNPVQLNKGEWPIIAQAKKWDNQYECQANRTWRLVVRQHKDGRAVVYGVYDTAWQHESGRRGGELVEAGGAVPAAVIRVAEYLDFAESLAEECVADLPAVRI